MEKELDPVIAAQMQALFEQCEMKGYAVVITTESENGNAAACRTYGNIKSVTNCINVAIFAVYDSLKGNDGLKNLYHKILMKTVKHLPDTWRKYHKKA